MQIDQDILEQLREAFTRLTGPVTLELWNSNHADQQSLVEMLYSIKNCSEFIHIETASNLQSETPYFTVSGIQQQKRLGFRGVPGGHEFTSLILSILQSDGKGKQPDPSLVRRIQAIRGPIRLKTFISLSCENCPDVVQSLNLMATLHKDFHHETIDGAVVPDQVEKLNIQGVPALFHENQLLLSGKSQLLELVERLEAFYGKNTSEKTHEYLGRYDVAVIGGGPAGVAAAIYTARKGLKTAIIAERMGGQLKETRGIENMISQSYTEGSRLSAQLQDHLNRYPVQIYEHRRVQELRSGQPHMLEMDSGETIEAQSLILATGAKWRQLGVPGEKEYIGRGVAFCAHCDGPFYSGKKVAVIGGGNSGIEAAIDLAAIANEVTLIEFNEQLRADRVLVEKFQSLPNAKLITHAKTLAVKGDGQKVIGMEYLDRRENKNHNLTVDGVFVQIGLLPNTQFLKDQLKLTDRGEIWVDEKGRTSLPGVYAAGDATTVPFKQIIIAMGDGAKTALTAFEDRLHHKNSA